MAVTLDSSIQTLPALIDEGARKAGEQVAHYYKKDGRWVPVTWAESRAIGRALTLGLYSLGVRRKDAVSILASTRREWSYMDGAILALGGVVVGIYHTSTPEQAEYIITHSGSRALVVENKKYFEALSVRLNHMPDITAVIVIDPEGVNLNGQVISFDDLMKRGQTLDKEQPSLYEELVRAVEPDDIATLVYTSGTTGPPKGAILTHRNLVATAINAARDLPISSQDVSLVFLPLAHSLQRITGYTGILTGATGYFAESIEKIQDNILEVRPTLLASVPRVFEKIHARILQKRADMTPFKRRLFDWAIATGDELAQLIRQRQPIPLGLQLRHRIADRLVLKPIRDRVGGRIRFFVSGGAPLAPEIAKFFHACGLLILEGYGLTETSAASTVNRPDDFKFGTVGKPCPGVEIKIANDGEILIRSPGVFQGYFKAPEQTREVLEPDGWFHSGDIGVMDSDGFLKITDRKKDIIITAGGKNIAPQNIEGMLKASALIANALVHADRRKFVSALIALDADETVRTLKLPQSLASNPRELAARPEVAKEIEAHLHKVNSQLAQYEQIKKYHVIGHDFTVDAGELTPTLKLKRRVIEQKYKDLLDSFYTED
ncbi:MAG: Long-chain-fatty-acid--CoA ligase FadD15 [Myxococcota bacterium]|nr:Long-chain-fatty-acid--CoA ligase FadD15 [Myxococcota bacterium]